MLSLNAFIDTRLKETLMYCTLCAHGRALKHVEYLRDKPKNAHIFSLRQHVSVSPVIIIITVCYNNSTFTVQISMQNVLKKHVMLHFIFL
jgi:hypothetical protein